MLDRNSHYGGVNLYKKIAIIHFKTITMSHKKESPVPQPSKPAFDPKKSREVPKPHPQHPDPELEEPVEDPGEGAHPHLPVPEQPGQDDDKEY
jgi:hypothetical protein